MYQGDYTSSLHSSHQFIWDRKVQVNQDWLKLNESHEFLVYADDINSSDGNVHTIKIISLDSS
jgi:hypothetical protein